MTIFKKGDRVILRGTVDANVGTAGDVPVLMDDAPTLARWCRAEYLELAPRARQSFQVDDRVRLVKRTPIDVRVGGGPQIGMLGTLKIVEPGMPLGYGVNFDEPVEEGHDLCERTKWGHGWYCAAENLELIEKDFQSETAEWIQALDETISEVRRVAVAAEAQSKAQALAFAEFERRWTERRHVLNRAIGDQEEAHVLLRDDVAENRQRIAVLAAKVKAILEGEDAQAALLD